MEDLIIKMMPYAKPTRKLFAHISLIKNCPLMTWAIIGLLILDTAPEYSGTSLILCNTTMRYYLGTSIVAILLSSAFFVTKAKDSKKHAYLYASCNSAMLFVYFVSLIALRVEYNDKLVELKGKRPLNAGSSKAEDYGEEPQTLLTRLVFKIFTVNLVLDLILYLFAVPIGWIYAITLQTPEAE